jgi:hypothetical protein
MPTRRPNLFLVGAPRCGTTALYTHLRAHPSVFMSPIKEPHYFDKDFYLPNPQAVIASEEQYLALFGGAGDQAWRGEASPSYLFSAVAADAIKAFSPDARIVITLRNPVDMMYSLYCLRVRTAIFRQAEETAPSFEAALAAGPARLRGEGLPEGAPTEPGRALYLCYEELGRFAGRVERFFRVFGRDAVHVVIFDDLKRDSSATLGVLCEFLGIDPLMQPRLGLTYEQRAGRVLPRSAALARFLWRPPSFVRASARALVPGPARRYLRRALERWNDVRPPDLRPETRRRVLDACTPDVERLGELIGRDLTHWLRESSAPR